MSETAQSRRLSAEQILLHPDPQQCEECGADTHFAVFRPYAVLPLCPVHLAPRLRARSYQKLLRLLWQAVYHHVGQALFEPQRAYWETLSDSEKWERVGQHVHARAAAAADEAVRAMHPRQPPEPALPSRLGVGILPRAISPRGC